MLASPYENRPRAEWPAITGRLVKAFPLPTGELLSAVEAAWSNLFMASFGDTGLRIGADIFLPAQATGVILERLIVLHLRRRRAGWRGGVAKVEKDVVCVDDPRYSFEIKTSSSRSGLYGNRSTGHRAANRTKFRSGYYLVINYKLPSELDPSRALSSVRFGWIDDADWVGQAQPTGQQASIGAELARLKLVSIKGSL